MLALLGDKLLGPLIGLGVLVVVILGAYATGHHMGSSSVQAEWDLAKATQASREDGVAHAVSSLASQLLSEMQTRLDNLEHEQLDAIDAARKVDAAPLDGRCSDVRRGIPSGVVRPLGKIR